MPLLRTCLRVAGATVKTAGNITCIGILASTACINGVLDWVARSTVRVVAFVTCASIDTDAMQPHKERYLTFQSPAETDANPSLPHPLVAYRSGTGGPHGKKDQLLDEEETLARVRKHFESRGKLPAFFGDKAQMTKMATNLITSEFGCLAPELLADDFQFVFPVVGPLTKAEFIEAFSSFKVGEAFPNARANYYNFNVDPLEPNRIWTMSRGIFVQEGTLRFGPNIVEPPKVKPGETPRKIHLPPQIFSMSFDDEGKCYKLTGGYCVDRAVGDTDGLGGLFGVLHALGRTLPLPEAKPWGPPPKGTRSLMWEVASLRGPQIVKDWKAAFAGDSERLVA